MQVRALVTAKDADDIWTVRVTVREQMMGWLADEHPYALPRVNTADAILPPSYNGNGHRSSPDGVPAQQRRYHGNHNSGRPER
jgi:hypothetical protein